MIENLRSKISAIDKKLLALLSKRFRYASKIKKEKKKKDLKINDARREKELRDFWSGIGRKKKINNVFLNKLFNLILKESKRIQNE